MQSFFGVYQSKGEAKNTERATARI